MIQELRLFIFGPKLTFDKKDLKMYDREILTRMEGNFHCIYKIPNSLIPRLQSRVILTTNQLAITTSKYDDGAIFDLEDFKEIKTEEEYLRAYTGDITIEVELGTREGESFADIVTESWKDIKNEHNTDLTDEEMEHVENQVERMYERGKEEQEKD